MLAALTDHLSLFVLLNGSLREPLSLGTADILSRLKLGWLPCAHTRITHIFLNGPLTKKCINIGQHEKISVSGIPHVSGRRDSVWSPARNGY